MSGPNILEDAKTNVQNNLPTYQEIASRLLDDKFLLTALELHTELVEAGKELRLLKDFFSNPGNFEHHTYEHSLPRSSSQATLDSLDLTRYSEDGEQSIDERVAVLEFQLRKAKETINALRNNLTVATESENNTPNKCAPHHLNPENIKPHEQRALNFLINEYLLSHGYKLTSITFSDENENQDFEDWDDVGLNISKPPELLTLYREGLKQTGHSLVTVECQTDSVFEDYNDLKQNFNEMVVQLNEKNIKLSQMESQVCSLQNEISDYKKQNDILIYNQKNYILTDNISDLPKQTVSLSSKNSTIGSNSPDHFEIIDKSTLLSKTEEGIVSLDDNISSNSFNETDWNDVTINTNESYIETIPTNHEKVSLLDILDDKNRNLPMTLKNELLSLCPVNIFQKIENDILNDILLNGVSSNKIVEILSQSLLRIIPNIILNKREEAVPLLVSAVLLSNDSSMRDRLLQQLFNLKKKPLESERTLILLGITAIAKFSQESLVENEVLPQCWEQLAHKYLERRLLVAESCIALIPYVSDSIRNSLILSMLQQMLEDREEAVRNVVVHALALVVVLCIDKDKYNQCEELAFTILKDASPAVVDSDTQVLFPVLAKWALELDYLKTRLITNLLHKLNDYLKIVKQESPTKTNYSDLVVRVLSVLDHVLPHIFMSIINVADVMDKIDVELTVEIRQDFLNLCTTLTNPNNFYKSDVNVGAMIHAFDKVLEENPNISWPDIDWLLDNIIPDLLNNLNHVDTTRHVQMRFFIDLFSHMCIIFGKNFTKHRIAPIFRMHVENLEQILSNFNQYCPSLNIIPVYLVSVLSYCDKDEITPVLKKFLCALPLCGTPLDCLEMTVKGLCDKGLEEIVVVSLWEAVVHQRPLVRAAAAGLFSSIVKLCSNTLLTTKITPAIVTLANDGDILVRTATVAALGCLIRDCKIKEVHDKAYMQLETYLADQNVLENHSLIRQLIVTMGNIVLNCKTSFKDEVIFPKLHFLATYTYQMTNQTRKVDMAAALIESYSKILLCGTLESYKVTNYIVPGLRYLEYIVKENPSLLSHYDVIMSMNKNLESKIDSSMTHQQNPEKSSKVSNQSVEDVRQKVSKIFNNPVVSKSTTLPNLQGIFKKK